MNLSKRKTEGLKMNSIARTKTLDIAKWIEWAGMATTLASMLCIRFDLMLLGFIIGLIGSALWLAFARIKQAYGLFALNAVLFMIYFTGVVDRV